MGCVCYESSLALDDRWPDNVFISGGKSSLTSQFCKNELGLIHILRIHEKISQL
jgi:hypothetical protein